MNHVDLMPPAPNLQAAFGKTNIKRRLLLERAHITHPLVKFIETFAAHHRFGDAVEKMLHPLFFELTMARRTGAAQRLKGRICRRHITCQCRIF